MFFESWTKVGEITLTALILYLVVIVLLRITGKRTTSTMNSFDWVVTVAMGTLLASTILNQVPILEGAAAILALVLLQLITATATSRSKSFQDVIKATPQLLFYQGEFDIEAMKHERISKEEILAALRSQGLSSFQKVRAVVLETNASLSVITGREDSEDQDDYSSLENVAH